jgi:hypothetical protein
MRNFRSPFRHSTSDFLFGLLSQLLLLILEVRCSTGDLLRNNPMPRLILEVFLALTKTFLNRIQRCSVCPEMSNKIALVSLDFAGTGSMCGGNKGVGGDGRAISRNNKTYLTELRSRLDKAAGIGRAADACAGAGFHEKGLEVALDMEQLLYEAATLLNAASLINRIGQQS